MTDAVTLAEHVGALDVVDAAALAVVLDALAGAGRRIAEELARAPLTGRLGLTGSTNVQGEAVKKLDVWANDVVVEALAATGLVCGVVSEEIAEPVHLDARCDGAGFVVCVDPVDGSSNLDVNGAVGTIVSVRRRAGQGGPGEGAGRHAHLEADLRAPGKVQLAGGYILYGPATVLVLAAGGRVDAFTLNRADGRFLRSSHGIRIPAGGRSYSVNEGNYRGWEPGLRRWADHVRGADGGEGPVWTARYAGALVADFHRTLLDGGVYLYPGEEEAGRGKLRLLYEAAPMALIAEYAGGRATTGRERILDLMASEPHQRVPLVIGSADDVARVEDFINGRQ